MKETVIIQINLNPGVALTGLRTNEQVQYVYPCCLCLIFDQSCPVFNKLRWPNTFFARALADAIRRAHKDCKNKHAVDASIILFAQCLLYLCYFSS